MKRRNLLWIVALCLFLNLTAYAAQMGSIRIVGLDHGVMLHYAASPSGILTEEFSGAAVADLSDSLAAVKNARALYEYAKTNGIQGSAGERDFFGDFYYVNLKEGYYLIYSTEEEAEFNPFLVQLPMIINGKVSYDIQAAPKADEEDPTDPTSPSTPTTPSDPSDPTDPTAPTQPEDPDIPGTGVIQWPKYLLLSLGVLLFLAGIVDVWRGRERA